MDDLFGKVLEIVTDYDLGGVTEASESPDKEYLFEAKTIYNFVISNNKVHTVTTDMLADNIQVIFIKSFGVLPDISLCRGMALEILAIM